MADDKKRRERKPPTKKVPMPEQDPNLRRRNFNEVALGYTAEQAVEEANKCLGCRNPRCVSGCPVEVPIREFINLVREEKFVEAAQKIKETNSLPAICGRVCPQETQCEESCIYGIRNEPIAVGRLERFVADYAREQGESIPKTTKRTGRKVAIIGSGPAGLTCAGDLVKLGHEVQVFEAFHKPGGVLMYGIPEFRLPKDIVEAEVEYLEKMGVQFRYNFVVGKIRTVDQLMEEDGFDAVFIGTGAGAPNFLRIEGMNLVDVFSANEILTRTNLMRGYKFPEYDTPVRVGDKVAVIGGGNVAMDAARTALRLGAAEVSIVYRRSREQMPARAEEIHHAEEEGIQFKLLINPTEVHGDDKNHVIGMSCVRMELGEPDESGRRRPIPIPKSEFVLDVDTVIVAIGNSPNPIVPESIPGLELTKWGTIVVDEETGMSSREGIFAGGDIVTGAATVISAMGAGKKAARGIHKFLTGETVEGESGSEDESKKSESEKRKKSKKSKQDK
ncbi:NADPH-dependent glutamate synthase [Candidatus Thorarchaeota archaeon]|nr:MAG: NADPH-dependent glutamate synthase [Candidatus Thorarchaeota archaeon]